ncbi:MAG: Holliday junction resolvase RuvX [Solirubrobacterales bacterium]
MRVLALDHGRARCGCAMSDPTGTLVRPLAAIARPDSGDGIEAIARLVARHRPAEIVVGLPLLESGSEGSQAAAARAFAGRLSAIVEPPVRLHDERYTTRQARDSRAFGASSEIDSLAAAHLLEAYLQSLAARRSGDGGR